MPLEIRELHFKVTIDNEEARMDRPKLIELIKERELRDKELLKACVERVLEILKDRDEP
ncbi:MAG: hypothetical protein KDD63_13375 [Bacteroidetes bacterium]|nr:hypothetical protein [Bacteroidota bacterium]MCB0842619.1 hypothetical protein [Bacteroidota bacterium]MCB0853210.1 hypothetical protein [Bacteroidota bacterium]